MCFCCNNIKLVKYDNFFDCCFISVWDKIKLIFGFLFKVRKFIIILLFIDDKMFEMVKLLDDIYNNDNIINKRFIVWFL